MLIHLESSNFTFFSSVCNKIMLDQFSGTTSSLIIF